MGRILFIRVIADTYDEKDVLRAWPGLCLLAFGEEYCRGRESSMFPQKHGVLELLQRLYDARDFDLFPAGVGERLRPALDDAEKLTKALESALEERDAQKAHGLANSIEDALDAMQKLID